MTRVLTALAAVAALALLAGCGGDKRTIPHDEGTSLIRLLKSARDLSGDPAKCPQLQITIQRIQGRVAALPASVDKDTRDSLVNGVNNLIDNARSECQNVPTTPTQTTPTPTTPTQTTPTATTPTQTTPTATTPTTPTTPTETTPGNGGATPGPPTVPPGQKKDGKKKKGEG